MAFGSHVGSLAASPRSARGGVEPGAIAGAAELADGHLFDEDDVFWQTQALPNETSAALVLLEHLWMKPLLDAIDRKRGSSSANEWVQAHEIVKVDVQRGVDA